jgi:hypothetical protein
LGIVFQKWQIFTARFTIRGLKKFNLTFSSVGLALLMGGIACGVFLLYLSKWGLGFEPDSVNYLDAAESLLVHGTLGHWLVYWPPLLPISLSIISKLVGIEVKDAAIVLQALLFSSNLALIYLMFQRAFKSHLVGVFCFTLFANIDSFLSIHFILYSEPLYLTFTLFGWLIYVSSFRNNNKYDCRLILVGISFSLATLTRYIGIMALPTLMLMELFKLRQYGVRLLLKRILTVSVSYCIPFFSWVLFKFVFIGESTHRSLNLHPLSAKQLRVFLETVAHHFGFSNVSIFSVMISLIGIHWVYKMCSAKRKGYYIRDCVSTRPWEGIAFFFSFAYLSLFCVVISVMDSSIRLDERTLIPIFPFILLFVLSTIQDGIKINQQTKVLISCLCLTFLFVHHIGYSYKFVKKFKENGLEYNNKDWNTSNTLIYLKSNKSKLHSSVFSNDPHALRFHLGRYYRYLPRKYNPQTKILNENFEVRMKKLKQDIANGKAMVVYFTERKRPNYASLLEMQKFGIHPKKVFNDGVIY